jgi:hypothetical protein
MGATIAYEAFSTRGTDSGILLRVPFADRSQSIQARTNKKPNMNIISLIIEAISGAVGGNVAGAAMKENSLGTVGNSIAGILGGGAGGMILQSIMGGSSPGGGGSLDMTTILSNVAGGGVGGAILMAVVGIIKNKMAKN